MLRPLRTALLALVIALVAPAAASAVSYGLGDASGAFARCVAGAAPCCENVGIDCPASAVAGYWSNPLFRQLTGAASRHRITEARFFVAYDAVEEFNGSTTSPGCRFSRALTERWTDAAGRLHHAGQSESDLRVSLIEAHADGLIPVVAIAGYIPTAMPAWDQPAPDPTTLAGYWEYRCGVQGILDAVSRLPAADQPHIWEAMNEPDGFPVYNGDAQGPKTSCSVALNGAADGAAKAACDYVLSAAEIHHFAGHAADTVIAGAFSHPSPVYLADYAALIRTQLPGALSPSTWSVHDYGDVTDAFAGPVFTALSAFDQALATDAGGGARDLWVTEAGTELTDPAVSENCPQAPGVPVTLGACVSGQPARQATAAADFFALPTAGVAVPITHLFWYQWQGASAWDSAITDGAGVPRAPWCAFFGAGVCDGNPNAA